MEADHVVCSRCGGKGCIDVGAEGGWVYDNSMPNRKYYPRPGEVKRECVTCKGKGEVFMAPIQRADGSWESTADKMNGKKYY